MAGRRIAASLGVLRIINLRALRRHAFRALLAAISLGGGVAVVVAVMIEATSVTKAVEDVGYRIAGPAPMRILGAANRAGVTRKPTCWLWASTARHDGSSTPRYARPASRNPRFRPHQPSSVKRWTRRRDWSPTSDSRL